MTMLPDRTLFRQIASAVDLGKRGFDGDWTGWMAHFALPKIEAGDDAPGFSRSVTQEDIRGSFVAIEQLAGYISRTLPLRPDNAISMDFAASAAEELEALARGLRAGIAHAVDGQDFNRKDTDR